MTVTRDALLSALTAAMDNRNDVDAKTHDFAAEAIFVLEQHALSGLTGVDREETIFELGFALADAEEREARKGNYSPGFSFLAEESLSWLEKQGVVKLPA